MTINRAFVLPAFLLIALSACDGAVPRADERQPYHPPAAPAPAPLPPRAPVAPRAPAVPTVPPAPQIQDWRDVPLPAGDWIWAQRPDGSAARFGVAGQPPIAILRCNRAASAVQIALPWNQAPEQGTAPRQASIATSTSSGTFSASPLTVDGQVMLAITLPATDRMLDAMAFSRGRFRVQISGLPSLVLPSWAEVGRVVEDCRG
jgi:hypothetical protein